MKKIWILGGGIAGIEAAISLRQDDFSVTVVSDRDFLFIRPISIWIPTHEKEFDEVTLPLSELAEVHGFDVIVDEVLSIDPSKSSFTLSLRGEIKYDYVIVALGGDKLSYKGSEHTISICGNPKDTLEIRDRIDQLVSRGRGAIAAGFAQNPIDVTGVRGVPAFEFIFNIHNMLKKQKLRNSFELFFFSPTQNPGERLGEKAAREFSKFFTKIKISTSFGKEIREFTKEGVVFEDNSSLYADFTMFIPGRCGPALLRDSNIPLSDAGFIKVNEYCQIEGYDNAFAIGDIVALDGPEWKIKEGHIAEVMARNAAFNIFSMENGSDARRSYIEQINLIFMVDMGNTASLFYRDLKRDLHFSVPIIGHWLKKGWGRYYRLSRLGKIPRIPGA